MRILAIYEVTLDSLTIYGKEGECELKRGDVLVVFDGKTVRMRNVVKDEPPRLGSTVRLPL